MTLPTSGTISTDMILNELRVSNPSRSYPLSLSDPDVLALAGRPSLPVTLPNDFYGKSSYTPMVVQAYGDAAYGDSSFRGATIYCYPSVSVSGGKGDKTYQWNIISVSPSMEILSTTSPNCAAKVTYGKFSNGSAEAQLTCTVTDSTGASVTSQVVYALIEWSNGNL